MHSPIYIRDQSFNNGNMQIGPGDHIPSLNLGMEAWQSNLQSLKLSKSYKSSVERNTIHPDYGHSKEECVVLVTVVVVVDVDNIVMHFKVGLCW